MIIYLDASALMKAFVEEPGSAIAREVWMTSDVLSTSWITYVETRSALARATREGRLTASQRTIATGELDDRWTSLLLVDVSPALIRAAGNLAEKRTLRGYDAVHLASALWLDDDTLVATWDRELAEAASQEGLAVLGPAAS